MYPIEERIKNLEQQIKQLESAIYYNHPMEDTTFFGVIREVITLVDPKDTTGKRCIGYLKVCPYSPHQPDNLNNLGKGKGTGQLIFQDPNEYPLARTQVNTRFDTVYVTNVPCAYLPALFYVGQQIKYHQYNGIGNVSDQADLIKGSYVTEANEPWEFWAEITTAVDPNTKEQLYKFAALKWSHATVNIQFNINKGFDYLILPTTNDKWTGYAINLGQPVPCPIYAKVTRMVNPDYRHVPPDDPAATGANLKTQEDRKFKFLFTPSKTPMRVVRADSGSGFGRGFYTCAIYEATPFGGSSTYKDIDPTTNVDVTLPLGPGDDFKSAILVNLLEIFSTAMELDIGRYYVAIYLRTNTDGREVWYTWGASLAPCS